MPHTTHTLRLPVPVLLAAFALSLSGLSQESMWGDEVWSLWAARDGWGDLWTRVSYDVHPPLYFSLLKCWTIVAGETAYAVRLLSAYFGITSLALTYALGRRLFDQWTGLIAVLWLGSSGLWIYYTRETRMYSLLICLAVLAMWCYWRWLHSPNVTIYLLGVAVSTAALAYLHYAGIFIIISQLVHLLVVQLRDSKSNLFKKGLLAYALAFLLYLPWIPTLIQQLSDHPNGLVSHPPASTNWATTAWIFQVLTGGAGLFLLLPYAFGKGRKIFDCRHEKFWFLTCWALLSPLLMLAINGWVGALYNVRFVIGVLPAFALVAGYGVRTVAYRPLALMLLLCYLSTNLLSLNWLQPAKAPWEQTIRRALLTRQPQEPTLMTLIAPHSLETYYDRLFGIRNAATIDLSTRRYRPQEVREQIEVLASAPAVWVMMPNNIGDSWVATAALDATHGIGYRDSVEYMLLYRFDRTLSTDLQFRFGKQVRYLDRLFSERPIRSPGAQFCRSIDLEILSDLPPIYSIGMHLVDGSNHLVAQHDQGLETRLGAERISPTFCIQIPPDALPGPYYLHLVVYTGRDGVRLPVYERETSWGSALIFEQLEVQLGNLD